MGKTILVSSHILPELADICNKIGIIEQGVLLVNGAVVDVMKQVRTDIVLNIGVADRTTDAANMLEAQPEVETVQDKNGVLIVKMNEGITQYSFLVPRLLEQGFDVTLFKEDEINLETAFMHLGTDHIDILQLHTWTRAWNRNPEPFAILRKLKQEGKIRFVGISTPEHDQNSVIDLMRGGWVDVVQVIYNIFEQEPAAELLPAAAESGVGVIVRVVFDEGSLTGKWTEETTFPEGDFRRGYFEGDRLTRSLVRARKVAKTIEGSGYTLPQAAIKFALAHNAVSTVIPGMRNLAQAEANCAVSDLPPMTAELQRALHVHNWRRAFWYSGK